MLSNLPFSKKLLSQPKNPKWIVFCDFDETYYSHRMTEEQREDVERLEAFVAEKSEAGQLMMGWVTGSSLDSVTSKMEKGRFSQFPHFIASNLGTEIVYTSKEHFGEPDVEWAKRLDQQGFSEEKIDAILQTIREKGMTLRPQTQLGSSRYKRNFYYQEQDERTDLHHLSFIQTLAKERGVAVNINKCNPLAGDPEDCYDIDFLPIGTGKDEIVRFMLSRYDLPEDRGFAFGDSGNDLRMLQSVTHGYLVQNATAEAKRHHHQICHHGYAKGIYETLKTVMYKHEEAHS